MNILEALDTTPQLPIKQKRMPRLDPRVIFREHIEEGMPVVIAQRRAGTQVCRFTPADWHAVQLFDGRRTYAEITAILNSEGYLWSEENVREFSALLLDTELFYKPPGEENITAAGKCAHDHRHKLRAKFGDLSEVEIAAFDADALITWIYSRCKFVYTPVFTLFTIVGFLVMGYLWLDRWGELWSDTFQFFGFRGRGIADLVEFWILFGLMVFWHECAHGVTCKHFGGEVHKIGFMLMYLMPTFFCDVSEVWIYSEKWARIATIVAGVWADLIICIFATLVWWATPQGMFLHDFSYKIMLLTGIAISLLQMNPLAKLDGYFIFCELIGVQNLKERSTEYVSSWTRKHIFGLPVEVDVVPHRRRALYLIYSLLSGLYSYVLLFIVVSFTYNVAHSYSPEWGFLAAAGMALLVFKSRIGKVMTLLKTVYLDKRDRWKNKLALWPGAPIAGAVLVLLFAPVWRETIDARFVLQPVRRAVIRAEVPGYVAAVLTDEGESISAGQELLQLSNLKLSSEAAEINSKFALASARAAEAQLTYREYGPADREKQSLAEQKRLLQDKIAKLSVTSPIAGTITTPRLNHLIGSFVRSGDELVEVADLTTLRARTYIPEFAMRDVHVGAPVRLHLDGSFGTFSGRLAEVAPANSQIDAGLESKSVYAGIHPPQYYVAVLEFTQTRGLRENFTGTAKILVSRRSLAGFAVRLVGDLVDRRVW
jgi:putative peptide zinc metalloprotease protein